MLYKLEMPNVHVSDGLFARTRGKRLLRSDTERAAGVWFSHLVLIKNTMIA